MKPCGLVLITNMISKGSGEPALLYNLVWISLPTKSFEGDKGQGRKNLDIGLRAMLLSMRTSILYQFYGFLSSPNAHRLKD